MRLQEFDVTIFYISRRKHSDDDCLSRAPVDPPPQNSDEDSTFVAVVTESDVATQQRAEPDLRVIIDYLQGRNVAVPRAFKHNLPAFSVKNCVLVRTNFSPKTGMNYLLFIPADHRDEILEACDYYPSSVHVGEARTIGKIKARYYWTHLTSDVTHYVLSCLD